MLEIMKQTRNIILGSFPCTPWCTILFTFAQCSSVFHKLALVHNVASTGLEGRSSTVETDGRYQANYLPTMSIKTMCFWVGAQFLPGILDANLCKNKQTNN